MRDIHEDSEDELRKQFYKKMIEAQEREASTTKALNFIIYVAGTFMFLIGLLIVLKEADII